VQITGRDAEKPLAGGRGWHSRGYLPHYDAAVVQMITYRLADALPLAVIERGLEGGGTEAHKRRRLEEYLDAGHGACVLRRPEVATLVIDNWHRFDGARYHLHAWVVMPNHAHVVIAVEPGQSLSRIVDSWKSYTATAINRCLKRRGQLWQKDYWDRVIRDEKHFISAVDYIHGNPVKARLVDRAEDWQWSSARKWLG